MSVSDKIRELMRQVKKLHGRTEALKNDSRYSTPEIEKLRAEEKKLLEDLGTLREKILEEMEKNPEISEIVKEERTISNEIETLRRERNALIEKVREQRTNKSM